MSKFIAPFLIVAATSGTCKVGDQSTVPPAPVEQTEQNEQAAATDQEGDRWAGLPEECRELAQPCDGCDEVERMRRQILTKKCVPVCDAYIDRGAMIEERVPDEGVAILEAPEICGKEGTSCSVIEESSCEHAVDYVDAGQTFRDFWAEPGAAPPPAELLARFSSGFLTGYLDAHAATIDWASDNEVDPRPILVAGGELMDLMSKEAIDGFRGEVTSAMGSDAELKRRYEASLALLELIRNPGDLSTWSQRRHDLESRLPAEDL